MLQRLRNEVMGSVSFLASFTAGLLDRWTALTFGWKQSMSQVMDGVDNFG